MKQFFILALLFCADLISACAPLDLTSSRPSSGAEAGYEPEERDDDDDDDDDAANDAGTSKREPSDGLVTLCSNGSDDVKAAQGENPNRSDLHGVLLPKSHPGHNC